MLALSINDTIPQVQFTQTTDNGDFYFWLDKKLNNKELLLQLINDSINLEKVEWNIDENYFSEKNYTKKRIELSPSDKRNIAEIKQLSLINSFYKNNTTNTKEYIEFYGSFIQYPPDYIRFPSEYSELNNFIDIVDNILPLVNIKFKYNYWGIDIYNPDTDILLSNPLILLDGVPFYDLDILVELPANEIHKIGVYHSKIFYGKYTLQGVIDIQTKQGKLPKSYKSNRTKVILNKVLPNDAGAINNSKTEDKYKPNFHEYYWNPQVLLNNNTTLPINITAPDFKGEYELKIEGTTNTRLPHFYY